MPQFQLYERAAPKFATTLAKRGHHVVYRSNSSNHCPGCGRSHWIIGRITAECGFCGTAIPLAEARTDYRADRTTQKAQSPEQRRSPREATPRQKLELLIDGSPVSFALHNISAGGAMGEGAGGLVAGAIVAVRSDDGRVVPAVVKWAEDGLVGLAFTTSP